MSGLTAVVLAHASMLVELMSAVRLCWISCIIFRTLRRGGGVAGWEDALYNPCIFLNDCSCGGVEGSEGINFLLKAIR